MSLSSFIKIPEHRNKIKSYFPRPKIKVQGEIKSPPLSKSGPIIGTALDYLIRFNIKYMYPKSKENVWVSELILRTQFSSGLVKYLKRAKVRYKKFLIDGKLTNDLIKSSIDLAKIDIFLRSGYYPDFIGKYKEEDIKDLKGILKNIDFSKFKFKNRCILNPNFGRASRNIGGADVDLIIDNKLIEIKNTKKLSITREMLNQIIGYYFLGKIGNVKGIINWSSITELGFFFPRYDCIYFIPVNELIIQKKIKDFEKWFKSKLK